MNNHSEPPSPKEANEPPRDESASFNGGMVALLGVFLALTAGFIYGAVRVADEPLHVLLVLMSVLTGLYTVYMLAVVVFFLITALLIEKKTGFLGRWPFWIWPPVVLLGLLWPLFAAVVGYTSSEWLWQGISVYGGILVILAIFFRRR